MERATRTILDYFAECRTCGWTGTFPSDAHVHVLANHHVVEETRHHTLAEPVPVVTTNAENGLDTPTAAD